MLYRDNFDLFIERSDVGKYIWRAVASTTDRDNYDDQTSPELFSNWLRRAVHEEEGVAWLSHTKQPYLSVAHYPSGGGELAAGTTTSMGIETDGAGNYRFVAEGVISDNEVGRAVVANYDPNKNIRISAGWWDVEHRHGDKVFRRNSMSDVCELCKAGQPKQYIDGQLVHFALTTVPVNTHTSFVLEEKSMKAKITKVQDAAAIVGDELAHSIAAASKAVGIERSEADDHLDALVVRAEAAVKTIDGKEFGVGDFLVVEDESKPSTWYLPVMQNGTPDHRLMGAAKAALTVGYRGNKYEGAMKDDALKKLKALYESEKMVWKSEATMNQVDETLLDDVLNGVTTGESEADIELSEIDDILGDDDESPIVLASVGVGDELDEVMKSEASRSEKMAAIDKILNDFALEVRSEVEENTPMDAVSLLEAKIAETQDTVATVAKSMAAMLDRLEVIAQKVDDTAVMKSEAPQTEEPVQRSMTAPVQNPVAQMNPESGKMSLRDIINRSVGIQ